MATDPIPAALERIEAAAQRGLMDWAEHVLDESSRIVPIEEGTLLRSGTTALDPATNTAYVGYGTGGAAAYAVRQHEVPMKHDAGRTDHYLSTPVAQSEQVALELVARQVRTVFG
jgi:hypothetical protein